MKDCATPIKLRPQRVVIVDDSRTMQAILEQTLSAQADFEVVGVASDGPSAVEMIDSLRPDLVTIDLHMPYIDGQQLLEALQEFPTVRKVVVSSHASASLEMRASLEKLGADACIAKSDLSRNPAAFCKTLRSLVSKPKVIARGPSEQAEPVQVARAEVPVETSVSTNGYPVPADEWQRLRALDRLQLANDDVSHRLDLLTAHLVQTTDYPAAIITFVDRETTWIKSGAGMPRGAVPRAQALCSHAICSDEPMIVPDAQGDARFKHMDAVTSGQVRAYIGYPITGSSGVRLGAICLLDAKPRRVSPGDLANLRSIARIAAEMIEPVTPEIEQAA